MFIPLVFAFLNFFVLHLFMFQAEVVKACYRFMHFQKHVFLIMTILYWIITGLSHTSLSFNPYDYSFYFTFIVVSYWCLVVPIVSLLGLGSDDS